MVVFLSDDVRNDDALQRIYTELGSCGSGQVGNDVSKRCLVQRLSSIERCHLQHYHLSHFLLRFNCHFPG